MSELKPCPCGKVPQSLTIGCPDQAKWGWVGCECQDWYTEFRNNYATDADVVNENARQAWNAARRADPHSLPGDVVEELKNIAAKSESGDVYRFVQQETDKGYRALAWCRKLFDAVREKP